MSIMTTNRLRSKLLATPAGEHCTGGPLPLPGHVTERRHALLPGWQQDSRGWVDAPATTEVDFINMAPRSRSPVKALAADPMCAEAGFCATAKAAAAATTGAAHSIDCDPWHHHTPGCRRASPSVACKMFEESVELLVGHRLVAMDDLDGPSFLFEPSTQHELASEPTTLHTDVYLSGPEEEYTSDPPSPLHANSVQAS